MARYELCKRFRLNETRLLSRAQLVMWMLRVNKRPQRVLSFRQCTVWTWYVFSLKYHYF
jgi:hypothetical protein